MPTLHESTSPVQTDYLIEPFFQPRPGLWASWCIYCKCVTPRVAGEDDLALLGALYRDRWNFVRDGCKVFHPVCPKCAEKPDNRWNGRPVCKSILPRIRRS